MDGNITMGFYNTDIMSRKAYIASSNYYRNMGFYDTLNDISNKNFEDNKST
jgi:hypothetical protein